jgi:nicotinate-nucleotide pyrophosphorylase (carboxylating)
LDPSLYRDVVRRALDEDLGAGDVTTNAIAGKDSRARGVLRARTPCTLAGLDVALETFAQLDPGVTAVFHFQDGGECAAGAVIGEVTGGARALLSAERTALNFLQHLSGIATMARKFVDLSGGAIAILDTRKTTPTLRALEKYAVRVGGAANHRMSLADGAVIKDNHIRVARGVANAVAQVRASGTGLPIEVEVENLEQMEAALKAGADVLRLDSMTIKQIREAVRRSHGRARTEICGDVTLERIPELMTSGADSVSSAALTHPVPAIDISFEIEPA